MSVVKSTIVIVLLFMSSLGLTQTVDSDTLLAKDNIMIPLPTISVNFGITNSFSDVKLESSGPSAFKQFGYQLTITQRVVKFLNASLNLYTGTIYGEQQIGQTNLNYRTTLFSQHVNVEYNFYPLLKPNNQGRQLIRPYVGFGLGMLSFRSKGDLKDEKGREYQYWSDGTINAEIEGTINPTEATSLQRDFQYETDLRDANLDGLRKYPQLAFSLPLNAGIRFQVSKNVGLNAAISYSFNFSDMLDNVSVDGTGNRKGASGYDNHLYGSVGLSIFLGTTKPSAKPKPIFEDNLVAEETKPEQFTPASSDVEPDDINDLEAISKRLKKASESIVQLAENSKTSLSKQSNELTEITNREIQSKKDLREAKKESIAVLDSSMAALKISGTGLIKATNDLNSAYTDFTDKKFDTRPSSTNKVKNSIEAKIPAIESLKLQVEEAKSAEELKAILNITSKNLTHTNDIFENESSRINQSILTSRKAVVKARVQQLQSNVQGVANGQTDEAITASGTPSSITAELHKLLEEGILNEQEYKQLTSTTRQSEEAIIARTEETNSTKATETIDQLASTTDLLSATSESVIQKADATKQALDGYNKQLLSLTQQEVRTNSDLNKAKKQAIEIIEKSSSALVETNESLNSATDNLNQASLTLPESERVDSQFASTIDLRELIEQTIPRLNATKAKIQSAQTSEDLKQVLRSTNLELSSTSNKISIETNKFSLTSLEFQERLTGQGELTDNNTDNSTTTPPVLTYEERISQVAAVRKKISSLQQEVTARQTETIALGQEISLNSKLRKPEMEALQALVNQQASTNQQIEALTTRLAQRNENGDEAQLEPSKTDVESRKQNKVKSKEEAIAILEAMNKELTETQKLLTGERTAIRNQEATLNKLGVVKAKIRLLEKMQSSSTESQGNLTETTAALNTELESLQSDEDLLSLIDKSEISALEERILKVKATADSKELVTSSDTESLQKANTATPKATEKPRSIEEIENTPPKETGGFMWADINDDGWISPNEVLHFIDLLFEGEAVRTVEDIQNLIDYYFDQE